jgi:hypothetical protein
LGAETEVARPLQNEHRGGRAEHPSVMIPTAIRDNHELGWPPMSLRSDAAIRTPTSKNGASTPLITAVQNSAFTGLTPRKSIPIPSNIEKISIA